MLFECVIYLESVPLDSINLCCNLDLVLKILRWKWFLILLLLVVLPFLHSGISSCVSFTKEKKITS